MDLWGGKREDGRKMMGRKAAAAVMLALVWAIPAGGEEPGWVSQEDGWHCYQEDGTPAEGWGQFQGRSCYLRGGLMVTDQMTPDGYYVDQEGAWYVRREDILDISFTAPGKPARPDEEWTGKEELEKLSGLLSYDLETADGYHLLVSQDSVEYVMVRTEGKGSLKKTVLLGLYREPDKERFRLDIRLDLDSGNGYPMLRAMAYQISSSPEILAEGLYSAWEKDNQWGIGRQQWRRVGDSMVLYGPGDGYGRFYICPGEEGN